ncbi:MAG TPA: ATP synthase F1 subunit gamma [Anaerolineales bacterium]|nr:ATP synthase F1 subunit gamma [Anaerolineales bacterium]
MPSLREMRLRIRSVGNIAQVTRALQAVSASRVRRAQQAVQATRPYATKAWDVLRHLALQPGRDFVHPLLTHREHVSRILVVLVSSDRGLAGAYNANIVRFGLEHFRQPPAPVQYVIVGRKGRDMLARRRVDILADFSNLPAEPRFADVSAIGRLAVDEYLQGKVDQVHLVYTRFVNLLRQEPTSMLLLPLEVDVEASRVMAFAGHGVSRGPQPAYLYEPSEAELIDQIVPRFTALQLYHAILESTASEQAARMVAMQSATQNAGELVSALRLEYNQARQQAITSDMLDIAGGVEALRQG